MTIKSATFQNVYGKNEISIHMKHVAKEFHKDDLCDAENANEWYIDKMSWRCEDFMKPTAKKLYDKVSNKSKEKLRDLLIEYLCSINFA